MLESNFVYVSATLSLFAVCYVVAKVILILHERDNYKDSFKYHVTTIVTGAVYELITIVTAFVIINDVILNIYCYLLLADAIFVFIAFVVYYMHYLMFKRRNKILEEQENEEAKATNQAVKTEERGAVAE